MSDSNTLRRLLQAHLKWHPARVVVLSALILAVLQMRSVCLMRLAPLISSKRSNATNYRRLQRFFALFDVDFLALARLMLALAPKEKLLVALDRTEWDVGRRRMNLLVVGYVHHGMAVPIFWRELDKPGPSNQDERIDLVKRLLQVLPASRIEAVVADREFMGSRFLSFLDEAGVGFVFRLRKNTSLYHRRNDRYEEQRLDAAFPDLAPGRRGRLRKRVLICGVKAFLVAAQQGEEPWFLMTNRRPTKAIEYYRARWSIETMFGAMKSRGFDLEATRLSASERLEKLVAVLALALVWALKVGLWRAREEPIRLKKHGRQAKSFFRHGLEYLQKHLLNRDWKALKPAFRLLSCT